MTNQLNYEWAYGIVRGCLQRGVDRFFVAPGSRCTPLTVAIAQSREAKAIQHFDERGLAFAAVGYGRASGRPGVVVCTSGTAVANLLPAVVEASMQQVPLLLLTADRPPELRDAGANQTIDQTKIFGAYVRWYFDVPCPTDRIHPRFVRSTIAHAIDQTRTGPVHLNLMFREPFGDPNAARSRMDPMPSSSCPVISSFDEIVIGGGNTLVTVGSCRPEEAQASRDLAARLSAPLLADIGSGMRGLMHDLQLLRSDNPAPDTVIHVGGRMTSKRWQQFLDVQAPSHRIHLSPLDDRIDPGHQIVERFVGPVGPLCAAVRLRRQGDAAFTRRWIQNSDETRALVDRLLTSSNELSEPMVSKLVAENMPSAHGLFLGNSMPIRDMDAFGTWSMPESRSVAANRGASGIDGLVAAAFGFALGRGGPVTAVIGDLSVLHDLNSLAMVRSSAVPVVVVVVNNDGGGIFHFLPVVEQSSEFEQFFGTPHGLELDHGAKMFQLDYYAPKSVPRFVADYQEASSKAGPALIEVRTDRRDNLKLHRTIENAIRGLSR